MWRRCGSIPSPASAGATCSSLWPRRTGRSGWRWESWASIYCWRSGSARRCARIGYAWWRRLHTLAFAVYLLTTLHGLGTGTDTRQAWALGLYAGSVALVGVLLVKRLLTPAGARGRAHPRLAALAVAVVLGGIAWAARGPAHAGWSAIASHIL